MFYSQMKVTVPQTLFRLYNKSAKPNKFKTPLACAQSVLTHALMRYCRGLTLAQGRYYMTFLMQKEPKSELRKERRGVQALTFDILCICSHLRVHLALLDK
ncbi:glutathione peroxidase 1 [Platysternon megacephalum]|uniref:Glutathione peroxidase 1 n=1 Tax=Platysternon megacephalum TaxID=55544 RepID=A0A4D9EBD3_9SAUR|nr:glutathione peroxidase 1 [Platysternon megacephalum]